MNDSAFSLASLIGFAARWLTFAGVLGVFGSVVFRLGVLARASLDDGLRSALGLRAARCGNVAALCVLPGALARVYFQTAEMRFPGDPWAPLAAKLLLHSSWGYLLIAQVGLALLAALLLWRISHSDALGLWRLIALVGLVLLVTPSLASHAMSGHTSRMITLPADMLHLLGAATWIGTLAIFFATLPIALNAAPSHGPSPLAALLVPFSPLALIGASVVVASGAVSAFAHLTMLGDLTDTPYGRWLLVKVALVLAVGAFGYRNWKRMTPRVGAVGGGPLRQSMAAELIVAVIVLAATSALVITPPPGMH